MDEDKLADLNDVQDFFNRSHSTSASGTFSTEQIDIKDFIEWCNDPCNNTSGNCDVDNAYRLGQTVCVLDKLDSKVIGKIYNILKDASSPMTANTDLNSLSYREKTKKIKELLDNARSELEVNESERSRKYHSRFMSSGVMGCVNLWLENSNEMAVDIIVDELDEMFQRILTGA